MVQKLKPAFNLQHGVDSEYITWLTVGPQPTDTTTLIPFLKETEESLAFKYKKVIADAGYESEENYVFLDKNQQLAFIKPSNCEKSKTRKYKNDIGRIENMNSDETNNSYLCKNGKHLAFAYTRHSKSKTFLKYRKENLERVLSNEGILLRTNRNIQAEGSFGELKQDMQFRRYLSRGSFLRLVIEVC